MISKTKSAWFEENKGHCYFFALKLNSRSSDFFSQKRREGQFVSQRQRPLWLLLYPCSWFSIKTGSGLHLIDIEWELKIEISRGRYWSSSFDFGSELNIQMNRGGQGSFSIDNRSELNIEMSRGGQCSIPIDVEPELKIEMSRWGQCVWHWWDTCAAVLLNSLATWDLYSVVVFFCIIFCISLFLGTFYSEARSWYKTINVRKINAIDTGSTLWNPCRQHWKSFQINSAHYLRRIFATKSLTSSLSSSAITFSRPPWSLAMWMQSSL